MLIHGFEYILNFYPVPSKFSADFASNHPTGVLGSLRNFLTVLLVVCTHLVTCEQLPCSHLCFCLFHFVLRDFTINVRYYMTQFHFIFCVYVYTNCLCIIIYYIIVINAQLQCTQWALSGSSPELPCSAPQHRASALIALLQRALIARFAAHSRHFLEQSTHCTTAVAQSGQSIRALETVAGTGWFLSRIRYHK